MGLLKSPTYYAEKHKDLYMKMAKEVASSSKAVRAKVGAVLYLNNHTLSIGFNGQPSGWDTEICEHNPLGLEGFSVTQSSVIHAECNAIGKVTDKELLKGAILFVNKAPCAGCSKLIIESGIRKVYYTDINNIPEEGMLALLKCKVSVSRLK
jgi:dCMP deaminase